jgi:hypothetical protein
VHVPVRPRGQPDLDLGVAVGSVVVAYAVNVQLCGYSLVDLAQESQELLMPMAGLAGGQHRAVKHVQGREQRGRAMALVIVGQYSPRHSQTPMPSCTSTFIRVARRLANR